MGTLISYPPLKFTFGAPPSTNYSSAVYCNLPRPEGYIYISMNKGTGGTTTVTIEGIGSVTANTTYDISAMDTISVSISDVIGGGSYSIASGTITLTH